MKLTSSQVEKTLSQYSAQPIPEDHGLVSQLSALFGDHTFFLDSNGLNIVEPATGVPQGAALPARVVNIANWADDNLSTLAPHEPEPTDTMIDLPATH
jgi:hypothetical protein